MKNLLIDFTSGILNFLFVISVFGFILSGVQNMIIELLGICFLSFLMGYMVGANKGSRDTTKIWEEAYKNHPQPHGYIPQRPCGEDRAQKHYTSFAGTRAAMSIRPCGVYRDTRGTEVRSLVMNQVILWRAIQSALVGTCISMCIVVPLHFLM